MKLRFVCLVWAVQCTAAFTRSLYSVYSTLHGSNAKNGIEKYRKSSISLNKKKRTKKNKENICMFELEK